MGRIQKTHQMLAILLLVALLIPMLAISSYASQKVSYDFYFNQNRTTKTGVKDDVGNLPAARQESALLVTILPWGM